MDNEVLIELHDCYEIINHVMRDPRITEDLWLNVASLQAKMYDVYHKLELFYADNNLCASSKNLFQSHE